MTLLGRKRQFIKENPDVQYPEFLKKFPKVPAWTFARIRNAVLGTAPKVQKSLLSLTVYRKEVSKSDDLFTILENLFKVLAEKHIANLQIIETIRPVRALEIRSFTK